MAFDFVGRRREDELVFRFREVALLREQLLRTDVLLAELFRVELLPLELGRRDGLERTQTSPVVQ